MTQITKGVTEFMFGPNLFSVPISYPTDIEVEPLIGGLIMDTPKVKMASHNSVNIKEGKWKRIERR